MVLKVQVSPSPRWVLPNINDTPLRGLFFLGGDMIRKTTYIKVETSGKERITKQPINISLTSQLEVSRNDINDIGETDILNEIDILVNLINEKIEFDNADIVIHDDGQQGIKKIYTTKKDPISKTNNTVKPVSKFSSMLKNRGLK